MIDMYLSVEVVEFHSLMILIFPANSPDAQLYTETGEDCYEGIHMYVIYKYNYTIFNTA